jgi:epoxyqueuosine reductase
VRSPTPPGAEPPGGSPAARLKARALALGFEAAGIARVEPLEALARYEAWLAAERHGGMHWLASPKHRERRADPAKLVAGIRSVLCVALCHPPERDAALDARAGRIARYAAGADYHALMKEKLGALERWIRTELFPGSGSLWYSDTGAILERGWAERAGLGWIGKHSGLLSPAMGSYFLLGEVLLDRDLEPDAPLGTEHCGSCTRCLDQCPTRAIVAPYQVDARLCISYLTIELRGPVPRELRPLVGDWIFGCDVCQEACPWNRFAPPAREARLHARALEGWTLERFLALDEAAFRELFAASPIRRADREGFLRNVCIALGNRADAAAVPALARALAGDPSPLVRGHAAWALGRIAAGGAAGGAAAAARAELRAAASGDADRFVREEASLALAGASP